MTTYENAVARQRTASTDADFRNYVADLHTLFTSCGWAVASDTGQLNEATVTLPLFNSYAAPRVYYLNDSLHSTYPIYLIVEYGVGTAASYNRVRFSTTSATNGAGVTMGSGTARLDNVVLIGQGSTSDVPLVYTAPAFGSYGDGYSVVCLGDNVYRNSSAPTVMIGVSREFDDTGALVSSNKYSVFHTTNSSTGYGFYSLDVTYANKWGTAAPSIVPLGTSDAGSTVELFPHYVRFPYASGIFTTVTYVNTDIGPLQELSASVLGVTRTYRTTNASRILGTAAYSAAIVWD